MICSFHVKIRSYLFIPDYSNIEWLRYRRNDLKLIKLTENSYINLFIKKMSQVYESVNN